MSADPPSPAMQPRFYDAAPVIDEFTRAFHAGGRAFFADLYRDHFATVNGAVGRVLGGVDRETVIHEVFFQLMTDTETRERFRGGSFRAWLSTLAKNRAVDFVRRRKRELPAGAEPHAATDTGTTRDMELEAEAKVLVEEFRQRVLPEKWAGVFEARFLRQLDQPEAARALGMSRTTLAYQEYRIRALLRRFVLGRR